MRDVTLVIRGKHEEGYSNEVAAEQYRRFCMSTVHPGVRTMPSFGGQTSGFDDAISDRVSDKLRHGVDLQLRHDPRAVGLHRFYADPQLGADLLVALTLRQQLQHLALPQRQTAGWPPGACFIL